jgi:hypothetical protein
MRALLATFTPRYGWREALDNSHCSLAVDLLRWRLRWNAGVDRDHTACELVWLYASLGPIHLQLAIGH